MVKNSEVFKGKISAKNNSTKGKLNYYQSSHKDLLKFIIKHILIMIIINKLNLLSLTQTIFLNNNYVMTSAIMFLSNLNKKNLSPLQLRNFFPGNVNSKIL